MTFNPNAAAPADSGIFGLPNTDSAEKEASLVYLPVPWEATTSYGGGTSNGPRAILEASRRPGRLDAPDEAFCDQHPESVVHRLERDGPNLPSYDLGDGVGRDVRLAGDRPHDCQSLGRDLNTALSKAFSRVRRHVRQRRSGCWTHSNI